MSPLFPYFLLFKKALFCFVSRAYSIPANLRTRRKGRKLFFLSASLIFPSSSSSSSYDPLLSVLLPVLLPICVCKSLMCLFLGKALGRKKLFLKAPFVFPPTLFRFRYQSSLFFSLLSPARGRRELGCYRKSLLPEEQKDGARGIGVLEREAGESLLCLPLATSFKCQS